MKFFGKNIDVVLWFTIVITIAIAMSLGAFAYTMVHNTHQNCVEIEQLKTRVRARATEDYSRLDDNARLLGIKVTPALRRAERDALQRTLDDYSASDCHGLFG